MEDHELFDPEKQRLEITTGAFKKLAEDYPRLTKEIANDILNEGDIIVERGESIRLPSGKMYRPPAQYFVRLNQKHSEYIYTLDYRMVDTMELFLDEDGAIFTIKDIE